MLEVLLILIRSGSQGSSVSVVTMVGAAQPGQWFFSLLNCVQTISGAHLASFSVGTHFHLLLRLRMRGAIPPLRICFH